MISGLEDYPQTVTVQPLPSSPARFATTSPQLKRCSPRRARCPSCKGRHTRRNGFSVAGSLRLRCTDCGASWRTGSKYKPPVSVEQAATADTMLLAGVREGEIARRLGVTRQWVFVRVRARRREAQAQAKLLAAATL